jgi:uncharacterized protein YrrD
VMTRWHLLHLPVRVADEARAWRRVQEVLFSWPEARVQGLVLDHWWPQVLYLPVGEGVRIDPMGICVSHRGLAMPRSRRWFQREALKTGQWLGRLVRDTSGRELGRVKDIVIDETSLRITGLVISRGLLRDLLDGAWLARWSSLTWDGDGRMKW